MTLSLLIAALMAVAAAPQAPARPRAYGPGVCGPLDPSYVRIATETGGQPFPMSPAETAKMGLIFAESSRSDAALLLWSGGGADAARDGYEIPVDDSIGRLTFNVTFDGTGGSVAITGPDGRPAAGPGVEDLVFSCGRSVSIDGPSAGTWRVVPSPTSRFWLTAQGRSAHDLLSVQFVRQGGRPGHEGLFPIEGSPIAGQPAILRVTVNDLEDPQPSFVLMSSEGRVVQRVALARIDDEEYAGPIELPDVPFRIGVTGRGSSGTTFQRLDNRLFRASVVEVVAQGADEVPAGRDTAITFLVRSHGARGRYRMTATVGGDVLRVDPPAIDFTSAVEHRVVARIPARLVSPASLSLELLVVAAAEDPSDPSSNSAFRRLTVKQ